MWGKSTKQRKAARRRHTKYAKRRRWDLKNLAFGFLYSNIPEVQYPAFIKEWLKSEERRKYDLTHRPVVHDYSELEIRVMANVKGQT